MLNESDNLKLRVLRAKAKLGPEFRLRAVWQYTYGKLNEEQYTFIRNCYYCRIADEGFTRKLEALAENSKNLPINP